MSDMVIFILVTLAIVGWAFWPDFRDWLNKRYIIEGNPSQGRFGRPGPWFRGK